MALVWREYIKKSPRPVTGDFPIAATAGDYSSSVPPVMARLRTRALCAFCTAFMRR